MTKREPKLLRVSAAAHELGLHPITVRRWIKAGRIQAVPMGREVRVPRTEVERLVGKIDGRLLVLYGRVSGHGQKADLDMQLERLQTWAATERKAWKRSFSPTLAQDSKPDGGTYNACSSWSVKTKWEKSPLPTKIGSPASV